MDLQKVKEALYEFERTKPGHMDIINEARKQLAELENTAYIDACDLVSDISSRVCNCNGDAWLDSDGIEVKIQQYAESYHAKKCDECEEKNKCNKCDIRYSSY